MKRLFFIFVSFLLIAPSCKKEQSTLSSGGISFKLPYQWRYPLHENNTIRSNSIIRAHLVFDEKALIPTTKQDESKWLTAVNIDSGDKLWEWNEVYQPETEKVSIKHAYNYENLMAYVVGGRHYCINLDNGESHWRLRRDYSFDNEIVGFEDLYFIMGFHSSDTLENFSTSVGYSGNIQNGNIEQFLYADIDFNTGGMIDLITSITEILPVEKDGKKYLVVITSDPYPDWYSKRLVNLYDLETNDWVYSRKIATDLSQNNGGSNLVANDKIYVNAGRAIACHDLWNGAQLWKRDFPQDFLFSGFIVEDGKVIANCENKVLYGLDADTGVTLWEGEGAGTSSYLRDKYLNGIVYFSGGSSGMIHAVDTDTGETVWRLDPRLMKDGSEDWKPDIYVVPERNGEKGKVIAMTPKYAYCFEAYR